MSRPASNIITFPNTPEPQSPVLPTASSRSQRLAKRPVQAGMPTNQKSEAVPQAMAMCAATPKTLPDPAIVAQVIIGFARRKGVAMNSVPIMFREQLLTLCAAGDPTGLMLRDWLNGNRQLLPLDQPSEWSRDNGNEGRA